METRKQETFDFDVMEGDRFVCSMKMPHSSIYKLRSEDVHEYIIKQRPSLAHRHYHIEF